MTINLFVSVSFASVPITLYANVCKCWAQILFQVERECRVVSLFEVILSRLISSVRVFNLGVCNV